MVRGKTNKTSRKLANNTYGRIAPSGDVVITLHATDIVTIHADGTYTLNTGGWRTYTTRSRMDQYTPFRLHGKCRTVSWDSGEWTITYHDGETRHSIEYHDGIRVSLDMFNQPVPWECERDCYEVNAEYSPDSASRV
jgi:hypothetical protein